MKKYIAVIVFVCSISGLFAQKNPGVMVIAPHQYEKHVKKDAVQLVDVRTPKEFSEGHIEGAENIDFLAEGFVEKFEKFDKQEPVYIYCRSGNRSAKASQLLREAGFETVIDLQGGYRSWTQHKPE